MVRSAALGLSLLLAGAAACHPRPRVSGRDEVHSALGASLDRYLSALTPFGFSGSALVAKDGEILLDKGYGLADRAKNRPYTAGTIFDRDPRQRLARRPPGDLRPPDVRKRDEDR